MTQFNNSLSKSILITGGAGFIGSSLADRLLSKGCKVIVVDNFSDYYDPQIKERNVALHLHDENYKLYRVDIKDNKALDYVFAGNKIDCVVHLAASAGVRPSLEDPLFYVQQNMVGTVNVLEAMIKSVVSGFRSLSVSTKCVPSMFETK